MFPVLIVLLSATPLTVKARFTKRVNYYGSINVTEITPTKTSAEVVHSGKIPEVMQEIWNIMEPMSEDSPLKHNNSLKADWFRKTHAGYLPSKNNTVWGRVKQLRPHWRHSRTPPPRWRHRKFIKSAGFLEVAIFIVTLGGWLLIYGFGRTRLSQAPHGAHVKLLSFWMAVGAVCFIVIHTTGQNHTSTLWITGYFLELVFSIENVFCFHIVLQACRTPDSLTRKPLCIVVLLQIAFQALLFMGLGEPLASAKIVPYLLGAWLIYVGFSAAMDDHEEDHDIRDSRAYGCISWCLGRRLFNEFKDDGSVFFHDCDNRTMVSLMFPTIVLLTFVDFMMEIDVTMTKIETIDGTFVCFTSSSVAALAVPELYFVARDLLQRYWMLRYGVAFVLLFYGQQLLLHRFYEVPVWVGLVIVVAAVFLSVVMNMLLDAMGLTKPVEAKENTEPQLESNSGPISTTDDKDRPIEAT